MSSARGESAARSPSHQAVLLIAFGGPESPDEIRPFLARVLRGIPIPQERIEEVVRHYDAVGGRSPINAITARQARALRVLLTEKNLALPVYVGLRNASPFLPETLEEMHAGGVQKALGFILSPQQSEAGWERYQKNVAEARAQLGKRAPEIDYCPDWHAHPLFIQTLAELIEPHLKAAGADRRGGIPLIFTAHSIPMTMASRSPYEAQVRETARLVAERLGHSRWSVAYQSRTGRPGEPWLEPDIGQALRELAADGVREVVVAPIGFVCDHVEVLYDLDIEAKKIADDLGMRFLRAGCPNDHPTFIRMIGDVIAATLSGEESRSP